MALSQKHRTSLFISLAPMVGEDEADALLSQFPSTDLDTPATKDFVRAEIVATKDELRAEMVAMKDELRAEMVAMKDELRAEMVAMEARLRAEMVAMEARLRAEMVVLGTGLAELRVEMHQQFRDQLKWLIGAGFSMMAITLTAMALMLTYLR